MFRNRSSFHLVVCLNAALCVSACVEGGDPDLDVSDDEMMEDTGAVEETGEDAGATTDAETGADEGETGDTGLETDADTGEADTGTETGGELMEAPLDGDSEVAPAVFAQFRATAGAPVFVDAPILDQEAAIDTKGLQYQNAISNPGDGEDWLRFKIVPGQVDPTIRFGLSCTDPDPAIRAVLLGPDDEVIETVVCSDELTNVLLKQASSLDLYHVRIDVLDGSEAYADYAVEIDAFCFQGCDYQPYQP